ncbi:MAG: adenine phosphoribosyltransferase [Betaproteobacteria bacterium TMED82]|nr:MAG: adenine phosphoribosyltransferase [Betaproteobacteria bacterium TMED82]|tara:strand:+ start:4285 stop:4830 length:546 start_codon:yes stop_codon:yes gene_type:complete
MSKTPAFSIKDNIITIPNYPKEGIMFRDVSSLLENPRGLRETTSIFAQKLKVIKFDKIAGIEARGFVFGAALSDRLNKSFIPIRKKGKLPRKRISQDYELEYGVDTLEVHESSVANGDKVVLVDDLIATGGTASASVKLITSLGGEIVASLFVIGLPELGGVDSLESQKITVITLCEFDGK